jgi:hypothetical protein
MNRVVWGVMLKLDRVEAVALTGLAISFVLTVVALATFVLF